MSEYFINFVKLALFIASVCLVWLSGGEVLYVTGIGMTVIYTASFIACLLLGMSIWIDMNGR